MKVFHLLSLTFMFACLTVWREIQLQWEIKQGVNLVVGYGNLQTLPVSSMLAILAAIIVLLFFLFGRKLSSLTDSFNLLHNLLRYDGQKSERKT